MHDHVLAVFYTVKSMRSPAHAVVMWGRPTPAFAYEFVNVRQLAAEHIWAMMLEDYAQRLRGKVTYAAHGAEKAKRAYDTATILPRPKTSGAWTYEVAA